MFRSFIWKMELSFALAQLTNLFFDTSMAVKSLLRDRTVHDRRSGLRDVHVRPNLVRCPLTKDLEGSSQMQLHSIHYFGPMPPESVLDMLHKCLSRSLGQVYLQKIFTSSIIHKNHLGHLFSSPQARGEQRRPVLSLCSASSRRNVAFCTT